MSTCNQQGATLPFVLSLPSPTRQVHPHSHVLWYIYTYTRRSNQPELVSKPIVWEHTATLKQLARQKPSHPRHACIIWMYLYMHFALLKRPWHNTPFASKKCSGGCVPTHGADVLVQLDNHASHIIYHIGDQNTHHIRGWNCKIHCLFYSLLYCLHIMVVDDRIFALSHFGKEPLW